MRQIDPEDVVKQGSTEPTKTFALAGSNITIETKIPADSAEQPQQQDSREIVEVTNAFEPYEKLLQEFNVKSLEQLREMLKTYRFIEKRFRE